MGENSEYSLKNVILLSHSTHRKLCAILYTVIVPIVFYIGAVCLSFKNIEVRFNFYDDKLFLFISIIVYSGCIFKCLNRKYIGEFNAHNVLFICAFFWSVAALLTAFLFQSSSLLLLIGIVCLINRTLFFRTQSRKLFNALRNFRMWKKIGTVFILRGKVIATCFLIVMHLRLKLVSVLLLAFFAAILTYFTFNVIRFPIGAILTVPLDIASKHAGFVNGQTNAAFLIAGVISSSFFFIVNQPANWLIYSLVFFSAIRIPANPVMRADCDTGRIKSYFVNRNRGLQL